MRYEVADLANRLPVSGPIAKPEEGTVDVVVTALSTKEPLDL
ncbi:hypothetical protein [Sphingomonas mucosissima]|nr:hypothetical protein [Sphingomonas mucosissima]